MPFRGGSRRITWTEPYGPPLADRIFFDYRPRTVGLNPMQFAYIAEINRFCEFHIVFELRGQIS